MRTVRRLLGYGRPHAAWVVGAVAAMMGVALATAVLFLLLGPLLEGLLGSGAGEVLSVPGAKMTKRATQQDNPVLRSFNAWLEATKARVSPHLPSEAAALVVIAFTLLLIKNLLTYLGHYAFFRAGLATVKDLRDALFDAIMRQSARFFQRQPSAVLMSRVTNDVEQITVLLSDRFSDLFQGIFTIVSLLVVVFSLNFKLALGALVIAPLLLWPIVDHARKLRRRSHQSQERLGDMNAILDEVLKGFRIVQAFSMEAYEALRFRDATRRHFRVNLKARRIMALNTPVMEVAGGAGVLVLLFYAGHQIRVGETTIAAFASFLGALYGMYLPIKQLNKLNLALQTAVAAGDRVFAVMDEPVEIVDLPHARSLSGVREGVRFERVSFAYEPDKPVLRELELEVPAGKIVALVGGSGAGKSTVAQLLTRFWDVDEGRITIDGTDIRDLKLHDLRNLMGNVNQEAILFNDTIYNNIAFGVESPSREAVITAAKVANAHEFILESDNGYDTVIGDRGSKLSGGQRQRLSIARAILKNPDILILDEATSSLDTESERLVQDALEKLLKNRTSIVIAHRLSTIRNADFICVLHKGKIVETGKHDDLLALNGRYTKLCQLQSF